MEVFHIIHFPTFKILINLNFTFGNYNTDENYHSIIAIKNNDRLSKGLKSFVYKRGVF